MKRAVFLALIHHQPGRLGEDRGMKGERSVYVKPLTGAPKEKRKTSSGLWRPDSTL